MAIAEVTGLKEINSWAWHIKCHTNDYIFVGSRAELKEALKRVAKEPKNAGSKVTYKAIVS